MDVWCFHERRKDSENLGNLVGIEPITPVNRSGSLIWYGNVDDDKC